MEDSTCRGLPDSVGELWFDSADAMQQLAARPVPTDFLVFHDELDSRPA